MVISPVHFPHKLRIALLYFYSGFKLVSTTELESALRLVAKSETGVIKGTCTDALSGSEKIVVYAYKKGTFNLETEKTPLKIRSAGKTHH